MCFFTAAKCPLTAPTARSIWHTQALLEGCNLAVSPKGDRIAVAGYPGLLVLDAKDGHVIGGHKATPYEKGDVPPANKMLAAAWNDKGTLVAAGWAFPNPKAPEPAVVLDADGKEVSRPKVAGAVMGVAFVPGGDTLLIGADQLTAVDAKDGKPLWTNPIKGAQAFAFAADGKTGAAGGWGKTVGAFNVADGKGDAVGFEAVVGGVAFLPNGDLAVAVWGGTHPLYVLRGDRRKAETLFQSRFGFQNVAWSDALKGLVAAEEGGKLWLLDADGKPKAELDETAGTTRVSDAAARRRRAAGPDESRGAAGEGAVGRGPRLSPRSQALLGNACREALLRVRSLDGTRSGASPTCVPKQSLARGSDDEALHRIPHLPDSCSLTAHPPAFAASESPASMNTSICWPT